MEFTRENTDQLIENAKVIGSSIATIVGVIAAATGNPQVKAQAIAALINGGLDALKPILGLIADSQNSKNLVPPIEDLIAQLEQLRQFQDLPTD